MKLSYGQMITLQSTTISENGKQPIPIVPALVTAPGLPVNVAIRLNTIMARIDEAMGHFFTQRDVIIRNHGVTLDTQKGELKLDPEGAPAEGVAGDLVQLANREIEELLSVETEGLPPIKASMLAKASGRAGEMLINYGVLGLIAPLILDDLDE